MRLIDADVLYEKSYWHGERPNVGNPYGDGVVAVDVSDIDDAPTINPESLRAKGEWETSVASDYDGLKVYDHIHRACGYYVRNYLESGDNFCPNCGADMRGE